MDNIARAADIHLRRSSTTSVRSESVNIFKVSTKNILDTYPRSSCGIHYKSPWYEGTANGYEFRLAGVEYILTLEESIWKTASSESQPNVKETFRKYMWQTHLGLPVKRITILCWVLVGRKRRWPMDFECTTIVQVMCYRDYRRSGISIFDVYRGSMSVRYGGRNTWVRLIKMEYW